MPTFTPPTAPYVPPVPGLPGRGERNPGWRLMQYYHPSLRGVNVFKMADGSYLRDDRHGVWPTTPDVPNDALNWTWGIGSSPMFIKTPIDNEVLFVYYGAHSYQIDDAEADRLVNAGFGDNVTVPVGRTMGEGTVGSGTLAFEMGGFEPGGSTSFGGGSFGGSGTFGGG